MESNTHGWVTYLASRASGALHGEAKAHAVDLHAVAHGGRWSIGFAPVARQCLQPSRVRPEADSPSL